MSFAGGRNSAWLSVFEGNLKDPDVNVWYIVGQLLRNAFIQALYPSQENSINLNSVGDGDKKETKLSKAYKDSGH